MNLIIATSINGLAGAIQGAGFNVVKTVDNSDELEKLFAMGNAPCDTLLVTEKINNTGSLIELLLSIKRQNPALRIIYLATGTLDDSYTVNQLATLVNGGIYDLFFKGKIDLNGLTDLLNRPRTIIDCQPIMDAQARNQANATPVMNTHQVVRPTSISQDVKKSNIVTVTSVKPGTGKSFISSNLAVTIAKYGKDNPKVLLLEGDLQTLSVSTLFGIRDELHNIKNCLARITTFLENHSVDEWFTGAHDVKQFIMDCCLPTGIANLSILEGHELSLEDVSDAESASYYYLADFLASKFDVIVADGNSSLQHPTTDPLFQLSNRLYFVYTTDHNNLRLNERYKKELENLGVESKVKYVLNKSLSGDQRTDFLQQFQYDDKDIIAGRMRIDFDIPFLDTAVTFNATYNKTPVANDGRYLTLPIRLKFLKLANDVFPIGNIDTVIGEYEALKKRTKGKRKKKKK